MKRGFFASIADTNAYTNSDKEWLVILEEYHRYWYDLVVNPHEAAEYFDSKELIVDVLRKVKAGVEADLEKRFVYFICSRERVRFDIDKNPSYNWFTRKTKIHLLVGQKRIKTRIYCKFVDRDRSRAFKPIIKISEKYITITNEWGELLTSSIHDFLADAGIALGLDSRVEYVGYTKNPETRPTDGKHSGLSATLHRLADESRDSIIYFNIFKVITVANDDSTLLNFAIANAMTDEINVVEEGKLIEKCFIFYFDAVGQDKNRKNELSELKNGLAAMLKDQKINKIRLHYEFQKVDEYGIFSSSRVKSSERHEFSVQLVDNQVKIIETGGLVRTIA